MPRERSPRRSPPEPRAGFIAVGLVRAPRGLDGELSVEAMTDFPERFQPGALLWAGDTRYTVRGSRWRRRALLLELEGIESEEQAQALRGLLLQVPEEELASLAKGRYYRFQIVGMDVEDRAGRPLGRIEGILDTGADDVYIVRNADGELLLPATDAVIKEVDVARRRMVAEPLPGLERRPLKSQQKS